jgi:hypothetical protein
MLGTEASRSFGGAPGRGAAHRVVQVGLEGGQLLLQPGEMRFEAARQPRVVRLAAALALAGDHFDQLAPAGDQRAERLGGGARQRSRRWLDGLGKTRDRLGIQAIGLGQAPGGAGEIADLPGVDHDQGQPSGSQRGGHRDLEAAGRFQHH